MAGFPMFQLFLPGGSTTVLSNTIKVLPVWHSITLPDQEGSLLIVLVPIVVCSGGRGRVGIKLGLDKVKGHGAVDKVGRQPLQLGKAD